MTGEDVGLRVRLETDPQVMARLGGPRLREAIERAHVKSLGSGRRGKVLATQDNPGRRNVPGRRG